MIKKILLTLLLLVVVFTGYLYLQAVASGQTDAVPAVAHATTTPGEADQTTIAFGSCNRQGSPQDYWATIARQEPDAWLWLGDNVYADTDDMRQMRQTYQQQKSNRFYADFRRSVPALYGTWDDHDYGKNDAGKEWTEKEAAEKLALDFLDVPSGAAVRSYPGLYQSYRVGDVKVLLLDTRYFRDELLSSPEPGVRYGPSADGDILGEEQWRWLENELENSKAKAHLIASSIQVLNTNHGYEKWANFPAARDRLFDLLERTRPALPLLISGDRHLAELMKTTLVSGYSLYEMTASGLTHTFESADEPNDKRLGPLVTRRNYGLLHYSSTGNGELQVRAEVRALDNDAVVSGINLPGGKLITSASSPNMSRTLQPCPKSPNCVSTQTDQDDKRRDPISFSGSATEARTKLKKVVGNMPRTKLIEEDGNYLHYTFKTWPIPFIDDVEFVIDEQESVIHYRSASRVGHSDLGVNSKRMAKVVEAFLN